MILNVEGLRFQQVVHVIYYHVANLPLPLYSGTGIRTTINTALRFCLSAAEAEPGGNDETYSPSLAEQPAQNLLGWGSHEIDVDINLVLVRVVLLR
jgi:hypothetical protein